MRMLVSVWIWSVGDVVELMDSNRATRSAMSSSFSSFSSAVAVTTGSVGSTSIASDSVMISVVLIESRVPS